MFYVNSDRNQGIYKLLGVFTIHDSLVQKLILYIPQSFKGSHQRRAKCITTDRVNFRVTRQKRSMAGQIWIHCALNLVIQILHDINTHAKIGKSETIQECPDNIW